MTRRPNLLRPEPRWPHWELLLPHLAPNAQLSASQLQKVHWRGWDTKWTALPEEVKMGFVRQLLATRRPRRSSLEMVLGYNDRPKWEAKDSEKSAR